jgi:hypothetical protein
MFNRGGPETAPRCQAMDCLKHAGFSSPIIANKQRDFFDRIKGYCTTIKIAYSINL